MKIIDTQKFEMKNEKGETIAKTGFVPRNEQLKSFDSVNTKIEVSNEKTKKSK